MLNKQTATAFGAGMAAMLGLMLALGATPTTSPSSWRTVGRYQISAENGSAWVVDTATGKVWNSKRDDAPVFFEPKTDVSRNK
jgi:D-alanyl-D-alanine carboxypeptidase